MRETADVSFVGGPIDGRSADVDLNDDGLPQPNLPQSWLWETYGSSSSALLTAAGR
jgi:hypothetical protein